MKIFIFLIFRWVSKQFYFKLKHSVSTVLYIAGFQQCKNAMQEDLFNKRFRICVCISMILRIQSEPILFDFINFSTKFNNLQYLISNEFPEFLIICPNVSLKKKFKQHSKKYSSLLHIKLSSVLQGTLYNTFSERQIILENFRCCSYQKTQN